MKKVFVSGDFNILHPGHLRLLKFAKESGDYLIVGVNSDNITHKGIPEDIRLESIQATSYVDEAFIVDKPLKEYIQELKPDIIVKGKEHKSNENPEKDILETYGGKLLFSSGEIGFSSLDLLEEDFQQNLSFIKSPEQYLKRHKINKPNLEQIINKFSNLNVLVIGDTIVDEYITCEPLGMSQEDPTIVVSPISSKKFIGGAAIVASHAKTLGADVSFISVIGKDDEHKFVKDYLESLKINMKLYVDPTRPTTLKQRFRANSKTLLRVNHLKQHSINNEIETNIIEHVKKNANNIDLIIFSDFSYGLLTQTIINNIEDIANEYNILISADSQSSSQIGDISKFTNMTLVTPTEREIRLAINDFESGLVVLSEKLNKKTDNKYIFTTLGSEGIVIYNSTSNGLLTDNIPALNLNAKDVSGAGDSLLTCASMALAVKASIWEAAYLGSIAAAIQVSRTGNIPIFKDELFNEI